MTFEPFLQSRAQVNRRGVGLGSARPYPQAQQSTLPGLSRAHGKKCTWTSDDLHRAASRNGFALTMSSRCSDRHIVAFLLSAFPCACVFMVRARPCCWEPSSSSRVRHPPKAGKAECRTEGHVGSVGRGPALGDSGHCHACPRGSSIHRGDGTTESGQRRQLMEPYARPDLGGQHVRQVSSPAPPPS